MEPQVAVRAPSFNATGGRAARGDRELVYQGGHVRDSGGSARPGAPARRRSLVALLLGALLLISACAPTQPKVLLTDAKLDTIGAGTEVCGLFGIDGPCVASSFTVFDPVLPPSPDLACGTLPGTNRQCVASTLASPLPAGAAVTLIQSFAAGGSSVFQRNSARGDGTMWPSGRVPYWMRGPGPYLVPLFPNP
jgi:hypothetical protein